MNGAEVEISYTFYSVIKSIFILIIIIHLTFLLNFYHYIRIQIPMYTIYLSGGLLFSIIGLLKYSTF